MTAEDRNLEAFFGNFVVAVVAKNHDKAVMSFHWPETVCFNGRCARGAVAPLGSSARRCNWDDILILAAWFLRYGPEVDTDWKMVALTGRCDPDDIYDAFLGEFIHGVERSPGYKVSGITDIDAAKCLEEFRYQASKPLSTRGTA